MSFLTFTNPGVIDPVAMLTFGVSAKDNDHSIGMFGTGLKYAIAILLRNGFEIEIQAGSNYYKFTSETMKIRDKEFGLVNMNGVSVNFTTDLGKFWDPWMAVRELASNALDEKGDWKLVSRCPNYNKSSDSTTIVVSGTGVDNLYATCKGVFLESKAIDSNEFAEVHPGVSSWIYYRGIRAMRLDKPTLYTYNLIAEHTLTEDRTLKYSYDVTSYLAKCVNLLNDKTMMSRIVSVDDSVYEAEFNYNHISITDKLIDVVNELTAAFKHVPSSLKTLCNKSILQTLSEQDACVLDAIDQQRLDKAIAFAERIGFNVTRYPIIVTAHLGDSVMGRAVDDKIYISKRTFHMGTKMLVGTLIEEYLHLSEGVDDCSRNMQNLLFDTICSLGERVTGEML